MSSSYMLENNCLKKAGHIKSKPKTTWNKSGKLWSVLCEHMASTNYPSGGSRILGRCYLPYNTISMQTQTQYEKHSRHSDHYHYRAHSWICFNFHFVMNTRAPMGHEVFKPKSLKISTHEHTIDEQVSSLHLNLIDLSKYMQEREDSCLFFLTHPVVKYGEWALAVLEEEQLCIGLVRALQFRNVESQLRRWFWTRGLSRRPWRGTAATATTPL